MGDTKSVVTTEMVPAISKITEHKLNGSNFLEWSKTIRVYLRSVEKDNHLDDDPPTDETKKIWLRDDARLFLQIRNSMDSEVIGLTTHCEYVKELMDYLEFLYSGKGNMSRIYDVCKSFYRVEKGDKTLTTYFMDFKKIYEELNMLLPFSADIKEQQAQREQMAIMSFLAGLPSDFETAKSQILSSSEITSLKDVFSRVLRTENTSSAQQDILVAKGGHDSGRKFDHREEKHKSSDSNTGTCNYCHEPGHWKKDCKKLKYRNSLQNRNQNDTRGRANIATTPSPSTDKSVLVSAEEFAKFSRFQESLKEFTSPAVAESGKASLVSASNKWVIDSGATDHMTGSFDEGDNW